MRYLRDQSRHVYYFACYVIYEIDTADYIRGLEAPSIDGLKVYVLESESDVRRLVDEGYEDLRRVVRPATRCLQGGAVGFCAFVNRDVAHIAWVGFTREAQRILDVVPYFVDFDHGEACWGGSFTAERFRNLGIYRHVMAWRLRYCHERGYRVLVDATRVDNAPSLRSQFTYNPRTRAFYRYRRFLRWCDCTEM
ncbi:MAG: hypothetical protein JW846_01875 [Dehalococcoidia bacterium]|nr:hypothetical protein [Dehalococcoidia bacterium]